MYNSVVFTSGMTIFITPQESAYINNKLLNGEKFFDIPRLNQTFNSSTVYYVGINSIFNEDKVRGSDFAFTQTSVVAKTKDGIEYQYTKGWKKTKDMFATAFSFSDYMKAQTIETGDSDPVNNPK